ncbi:tyrosine recombinase [Lactococcus lactis subsp. lactis IO-1]|nr:tyrosine recombinase [Lactococcus lactis subsp. lactis IO-1]
MRMNKIYKKVQNKSGQEKTDRKVLSFEVNEFIQSKDTVPLSIASIYSYCLEFRKYLKWMSENNITNHANIKEITLKEMENVTKREIEAFVLHERLRLESKCGSNTHTSALNRTIAAIKSLYNYLCEQTEDSNGNTYMTRNVSRLIHIRKKSETLHYRAAQLEGKLFLGDETKAFLEFVEHEYEKSISNRARTSFKKNKVRDLAILSLFLSSGFSHSQVLVSNQLGHSSTKPTELYTHIVSAEAKDALKKL